MDFTLRLLQYNDIEELISWVNNAEELLLFAGSAYTFPLTVTQVEETLLDASKICFAFVDGNDKMLGHCQLFISPENIKIARVIISPSQRGNSLGRIMMNQLLIYIQENFPFQVVELNVFTQNISALNLYESLGFVRREIGEKVMEMNGKTWVSVRMIFV